jgi:hypothetical protein
VPLLTWTPMATWICLISGSSNELLAAAVERIRASSSYLTAGIWLLKFLGLCVRCADRMLLEGG